ncbi:hypothetical protein HN451_09810 [archaeon]|nr:hypothetical protein [archaeon]
MTYNFSHPRKISTSNQFIDYIKLNYAVSNNIFKLAFGATRESSRATFVVKDNPIEIANISCFDSEEPYQGEQYSETFGFNNRNNRVGAFTPLEGRVSGLNIAKKEMDSEKKALARQHSKLARIIKATSKFCASVLLITCLANYTSMKIEHCNNTQEYSFLRMIRNRLPKDQVDYGKEISPQIYEFVDSSKEVIAIDRFIPTKKMRYAYSPERCLEETKHLLDLLCHNGNILNNIVVCENPYRKDFDKKFEERPNPTQTEKLERVSFNLNAIEEVSGVTLGEPKIIPFGIPFLTENDYYRDYRQGIEIKVKGEEKPYLITAKYHGNDNDIKQLLFVMHTYIGFRKQEGNNNDKKIELVVDSKFMDEVTNLSKQFSEYQYHKQLFKLENNSLKYNEIRIDPYLNNGQIDYKITVGKKTCIRWKKTISGVSATWKGVSLTCDRYYARPIFTINTAHLSAIKAGDNDNNKNILYIETRNPLKLKAHQIPHEAAKKLEKLLQPFAKPD